MIEKEKKLCWKDWIYGNLVSFMKQHENSKRNPVTKIFHDRNASWQISLWYKSWENTTKIAKWRCITKLGKSIRYHFVAGICKLASGSYTTREPEAVFKAKKQKETQCQSMSIQLFYCKNKGHVEKLCWKKTVERNCSSIFFEYCYGNASVRRRSRGFCFAHNFSFESQPSTTNVIVIVNIEVNECYSHGSSQQCINTSAKLGQLLKE